MYEAMDIHSLENKILQAAACLQFSTKPNF